MSYYDMGCDSDLRAEAREELWRDAYPPYGDFGAVTIIKSVLTDDVRTKLNAALKSVCSDEGCDALGALIDDVIPQIDLWISACEEEGEA